MSSAGRKKSGSPLTAWLGTLDAERLGTVLAARPDAVAAPEPRGLGELADRLQRPRSVLAAVRRLTLPCLQAAEALAALGPAATRPRLAALLGAPRAADGEAEAALDRALAMLADHALVWPGKDESLHLAAALGNVWSAPLGLEPPISALVSGATSEDLRGMLSKLGVKPPASKAERLAALLEFYRSAERITAAVAEAPAATRRMLEKRALADQPVRLILFGSPSDDGGPAVRWAVERGLLVQERYRYSPARMPSEVALALRGPDWRAPFAPVPPVPRTAPVTAEEVERECASAAGAFAVQAASVLTECAARPPARLKAGGVGARELGRIGKAAQSGEPVVRLVLETGLAAGLLAHEDGAVKVTAAYDSWAGQEPGAQLARLLCAWWQLPGTPTLARDEDGKAVPALAGAGAGDGAPAARRGLVAALRGLPSGQGAAVPRELGPLVEWHCPLADHLVQDATPFASLIDEALLLGVLARGALSPLGAALADGDPGLLTDRAVALLPRATDRVRIGSDLTAVVTGAPSGRLTALLDSVADREARGTASVWRFSPASVRRALDAGRDARSIEADLAAAAGGSLPQTLGYLIADTARRHGHLRVVSAACVVHGTEPALLAEIAAHRGLAKLRLRQLAPTVVISGAAAADTLAALRKYGYAPVAEGRDGAVRIERTAPQRAESAAPARAPRPAAAPPADAAGLRALAARLLSKPDGGEDDEAGSGGGTEKDIAAWAEQLSNADLRQLAHAIRSGEPVTIEYVSGSGARTERTISDLELDPPYLFAWCHLREDDRVFTLSRIQGVMPG